MHPKNSLLPLALFAAFFIAAPVAAERPNQPMASLAESPYQLEVTILSIEEKAQTSQITSVWHRVRVERVFVGSGLKQGDETAVVSQVRSNPSMTTGSSGHRGPFTGPNGLPIKGDRARIFAGGTASILYTRSPNGWQNAERMISFVAADEECHSDSTMPLLATLLATLVSDAKIATTQMHYATADDGTGSPSKTPDASARTSLTDDARMSNADCTVLCMRERELGYNTMLSFKAATTQGLPLVGFRSSLHAFAYPNDAGGKQWNDDFPREQFGANWKFQHGSSSKTRVLAPDAEAAKHAILAGVVIPTEGLVLPSSLIEIGPLTPDCRVLLWGEAIDSERKEAAQKQPILWTRELKRESDLPPRRIAFTTLGDQGDFANPEFRVISVQMIAWAIGEEARIKPALK
jgi:hypothetical protein